MRVPRPSFGAPLAAAAGGCGLPAPALAHAFAQRYDLPLPLWHYLAGAGAAVALSFLVVARLNGPAFAARPASALNPAGAGPRPAGYGLRLAPAVARPALGAARGLGVALLVLLVAAGLLGPQGDWDANLLPVSVWILWWTGLAFCCALLGDLWRPLEPWVAVRGLRCASLSMPAASAGAAAAATATSKARPWRRRVAALGAWPAVAGFLAFSWCELVWTANADPRKLAVLVLAYAAVAGAGVALLGAEVWRQRFDPFAAFFALFARVAPLAWWRERDGALRGAWRAPGAGLSVGRLPSVAQTAFVIVALSAVGFDGLAETPLWEAVVGESLAALYAAGVVQALGYEAAGTMVKTLGLLLTPLLFAAAYGLVCAWTGRLVGEAGARVARRFVLSLVPIAVGYHLAHYLSYLLIQGQAALPLLSDPLGWGWDLFGTRGREIDLEVIGMRTVWFFAVLAIVVGHVCAVVVGHRTALAAYGARATRSQLPMLALMIGYTMSSLWILSQPIVH
jgi:hypothetical protein